MLFRPSATKVWMCLIISLFLRPCTRRKVIALRNSVPADPVAMQEAANAALSAMMPVKVAQKISKWFFSTNELILKKLVIRFPVLGTFVSQFLEGEGTRGGRKEEGGWGRSEEREEKEEREEREERTSVVSLLITFIDSFTLSDTVILSDDMQVRLQVLERNTECLRSSSSHDVYRYLP